MQGSQSLKEEILKKWILGLRVCDLSKKKMNIVERKKAIKLSADIAMASTRNCTTCWSRAIVAQASKDDDNKVVVDQILSSDASKNLEKVKNLERMGKNKRIIRSKKILKKSRLAVKRVGRSKSVAESVAKRLVKNRTQVLKRLVPGGEFMDDISLIGETLDYIVSLRAQVDVMRTLAKATELLDAKWNTSYDIEY